jgi:tetratricopeptide (TPR) repeat protein
MGLLFVAIVFFFIKHILAPRKMDYILNMIESGQYKKAIAEAQLLIKKNERNHRAHFLLGEALFGNKQMEEAMIEFKFLTKLSRYDDLVPEESVRNRLAEIFLHFGQLEEAQKEFLLMIKLKPAFTKCCSRSPNCSGTATTRRMLYLLRQVCRSTRNSRKPLIRRNDPVQMKKKRERS